MHWRPRRNAGAFGLPGDASWGSDNSTTWSPPTVVFQRTTEISGRLCSALLCPPHLRDRDDASKVPYRAETPEIQRKKRPVESSMGQNESCVTRSGCIPIEGHKLPHITNEECKILEVEGRAVDSHHVVDVHGALHQAKSAMHTEWLQRTLTSAHHPDGVARQKAHQEWLTQMLEMAAAHAAAQKHEAWLDKQRLCAERIQGTRDCHDAWLADPLRRARGGDIRRAPRRPSVWRAGATIPLADRLLAHGRAGR